MMFIFPKNGNRVISLCRKLNSTLIFFLNYQNPCRESKIMSKSTIGLKLCYADIEIIKISNLTVTPCLLGGWRPLLVCMVCFAQ